MSLKKKSRFKTTRERGGGNMINLIRILYLGVTHTLLILPFTNEWLLNFFLLLRPHIFNSGKKAKSKGKRHKSNFSKRLQ